MPRDGSFATVCILAGMAHILLGVTGSIAAFKACHLASDWTKAGHEVRVIETAAAERFVTPLTFTSLTHTQTRTVMFPNVTAAAIQGDVISNPADPASINHMGGCAGRRAGERRRHRPHRRGAGGRYAHLHDSRLFRRHQGAVPGHERAYVRESGDPTQPANLQGARMDGRGTRIRQSGVRRYR